MGLKLSELLEKAIKLQEIKFDPVYNNFLSYIQDIDSSLENLSHINTTEIKQMSNELKSLLEKHHDAAMDISKNLKKIVYNNTDQYIKTSENNWKENLEKMLFHEHSEWAKLWPPNKEELTTFLARVSGFSNWQYPGIIFGAKNHDIIKSINCEPLYILENYKEYFTLQKEHFHPDHARKLKFYHINDIKLLPKNSVGLIVAFNEFNFLPWHVTVSILQKFISFLAPGGRLIFNYNNCKTVRGFREFENKSMIYSTPNMFIDILYKENFVLQEHYISDKETFSYMIFQKAGHRNLIKKYPSVGFVKQQPTFVTHDIYHKKRIELIRKLCKK